MRVLGFIFAIVSFFSTANAYYFYLDQEKNPDQEIMDVIQSSTFSKEVIYYPFKNESYPVLLIHNPEKHPLWSEAFSGLVSYSLLVIGDLPDGLKAHLSQLLGGQNLEGTYLGFSHNVKEYEKLEPVHVAKSMDDPVTDSLVQKIFSSEKFSSQVLHYLIDNEHIMVRIIHNPQDRCLNLVKPFVSYKGETKLASIILDYRYMIVSNKEISEGWINHLSRDLGFWDRIYHFKMFNASIAYYDETSSLEEGLIKTRTHCLGNVFDLVKTLR
jgi:hypothetical protein